MINVKQASKATQMRLVLPIRTMTLMIPRRVKLHEELKKLAKIYADRKRVILVHEKKIIEMHKFIDELQFQNETS
ncbi:hypothetical protein Lal_00039573 [Lupinus albus]|nr:hypothetical protein Lal_00039573 [Lupinus albus]